jgi:hypothetical protein
MKQDVVGGAVIAIIIVVSFLSLMSFAEFLRFQWGGEGAGEQQQPRRRNDVRGGAPPAAVGDSPIEGEIDDIALPREEVRREVDEDDYDGPDPISFALDGLRRNEPQKKQ